MTAFRTASLAFTLIGLIGLFATIPAADPPMPGVAGKGVAALSPREEQATFKLLAGLKIELVAAEPDVIDPVSMCFDERGRLFVCEMRGYPNGGIGTGNETRGRIKCLTDKNGDGVFETATVFAEGLRFPMGITPWKGGMIVAVAPDILYLEDTDGDGKADKTTVLYTGFNLANIQQMVNSLQWAADGWIHGVAGNSAGTIRSGEKPDQAPVVLLSRGFRFRPDVPGSLEPVSGGGQYGLAADDFGHWFTATNSQHLRQIVIPDHYLRRNPSAIVTAVTLDIPDHGAACQIHRISPFEGWRVERTTRRAGSADAKRFPTTELTPGGFITSACSPIVYNAELLPEKYSGNSFVCDPANNLIHRDGLVPNGAVFSAQRADADCEFLASTDNWFRPVHQMIGPDGAIYVLDFYREVIETPLSLPDDIKAKLNLESRGRGRIWRIASNDFAPKALPNLAGDTNDQLAAKLLNPTPWVRLAAHRLLCERNAKAVTPKVRELAKSSAGKPGLPLLLSILDRFNDLSDELILASLGDSVSGNREVALRYAEPRLESSAVLRAAVSKLAVDPSAMVRFQVALTAGFLPSDAAGPALAELMRRDAGDPWTTSAVLCSARESLPDLMIHMLQAAPPAGDKQVAMQSFLRRAATTIGAKADDKVLTRIITALAEDRVQQSGFSLAVLEGLGQGMRGNKLNLTAWLAKPPDEVLAAVKTIQKRWADSVIKLRDESQPVNVRLDAARLLAFAPYNTAALPLTEALTPQTPHELQLAAVRALGGHNNASVPSLLLKPWDQYGPSVRREIIEQLLTIPARTNALLDAIEKHQVKPAEIEPARIVQLKNHSTLVIRTRAVKLFAGQGGEDRKKVLADYKSVLDLAANTERGKALFKHHCVACHKVNNEGHDVGPNLLAVITGKSTDDLLTSILDPNREVDPRYINYLANTADGRVLTGIITAETAGAITLRRSEGGEDTIRRSDLESLRSTGISLMPEGLEKNITKQEMADLIAFVRELAAKK